MLHTTRQVGETVVLHTLCGPVVITVLEAGPSKAKLTVDAPLEVRVLRGELASRGADGGGGDTADRTGSGPEPGR